MEHFNEYEGSGYDNDYDYEGSGDTEHNLCSGSRIDDEDCHNDYEDYYGSGSGDCCADQDSGCWTDDECNPWQPHNPEPNPEPTTINPITSKPITTTPEFNESGSGHIGLSNHLVLFSVITIMLSYIL